MNIRKLVATLLALLPGCSVALEGTRPTPVDNAARAAAKAEWDQYADTFGLEKDDFGRSVTLNSKTFTIAGFRLNADKRVVWIDGPGGKRFVTNVPTIKRALGRPVLKEDV